MSTLVLRTRSGLISHAAALDPNKIHNTLFVPNAITFHPPRNSRKRF